MSAVPAPAASRAWQSFLKIAASLGCDSDALRWLMFGVGAHPLLIGHAEVLERVRRALESPAFAAAADWGSRAWVDQIPAWRDSLARLGAARTEIARAPGLEDYDARSRGRSGRSHPLMRKGITLAPVAAALWSRHAFSDDPDQAKRAVAARFERLQFHLLAANLESRARSGHTVEEFEQFAPTTVEFAPVPVSADGVSRAVRLLSEAPHAPLVDRLPEDDDSVTFSEQLQAWAASIPVLSLPADAHLHMLDYVGELARYFQRLPQILDAAVLQQRRRRARSSEGHRSERPAIHGFVAGPPGLLVAAPEDSERDHPGQVVVTLEPPRAGPESFRDALEQGLAPPDVVVGGLELIDPESIAGRLSRLKWQQIASQMSAQDFVWDIDRLGAPECRALMTAACDRVRNSLLQRADPAAVELGRGALLGALMLWLGQSAERVAELETVELDVAEGQTESGVVRGLVDERPARLRLLLRAPKEGERAPRALAFLVPAIEPDYSLDEEGARTRRASMDLGRARAGHVVLWAGVVGAMVAHFALRIAGISRGRVFGTAADSPQALVQAFLADVAGTVRPPGLDPNRVRLETTLARMVRHRTGEPTAGWLICQQTQRTAQARLYYTQHRLRALAEMHADAIRALHLDDAPREGEVALPLLDGDLGALCVGARLVARLEVVQQLVVTLAKEVSTKAHCQRRSEVRRQHNAFALYVLVLQALCTGVRAVRSPTSLIAAWQQSNEILGPGALAFAGLQDKETYYNQRARLVPLPSLLMEQLAELERHNSSVVLLADIHPAWQRLDPDARALFVLDDSLEPRPVTVAWIQDELARRACPLPANFARAFLRTELLERGCPPASLDAWLGHHDLTRPLHANHAAFDFKLHRRRLEALLAGLHADLGLRALRSGLVPDGLRNDSTWLPPARELALLGRAGPPKRERRLKQKEAEETKWPELWRQVHADATRDDRAEVRIVLRLLRFLARRRGNRLAAFLLNPPSSAPAPGNGTVAQQGSVEDAEQIQQLIVRFVLSSGKPRLHQAASWLRLVLAMRKRLARLGWDTPPTQLLASVRLPTSPFIAPAVMAVPLVDRWRAALLDWAANHRAPLPAADGGRKQRLDTEAAVAGRVETRESVPARARAASPAANADARGNGLSTQECAPQPTDSEPTEQLWACAILLSAVLFGGLLDRTKLSQLCARIATRHADGLDLAAGRAYLEFELPYNGPADLQLHRWWMDPVSEILWLRAPALVGPFSLGGLLPRIRDLAREVGLPLGLTPTSWGDLLNRAEIWWLSRSSRLDTQAVRRRFPSSSVRRDRWLQLCNPSRLEPRIATRASSPRPALLSSGAASHPPSPAPEGAAGVAHEGPDEDPSEAEAAFSRSESASHEETELASSQAHMAALESFHDWVPHIAQRLELQTPVDMSERGATGLAQRSPAAATLLNWAAWLRSPEGGKLPPREAARRFSATAMAVLGEIGDEDPSALDSAAMAELARKLLERTEAAGPSKQSLRFGLTALAVFLKADAGIDEVIEEDDEDLVRVDARVISMDEFDRVMDALNQVTEAEPDERKVARLVLLLCFRLGLRPKEAYGLRLCDHLGDSLQVVEYPGYTLKSSNARRRSPLRVLLPAEEHDRLAHWVAELRNRCGRADAALVQLPSTLVRAPRERIDRVIHAAMRTTLHDPALRLYHGRHSFASWLNLAMRFDQHPLVEALLSHLPKTVEWMRNGKNMARELLGADADNGGRHAFVTARLVGHIGPGVTYQHYSHLDDMVRASIVERANSSITNKDWIAASGLSRTVGYEALEGGLHALVLKVRRANGWKTKPVDDVGDEAEADANGWTGAARVQAATQDVCARGLPIERVAALHKLEVDQLDVMVRRLRELLPKLAQPGHRAKLEAERGVLVRIPLSQDARTLLTRLEARIAALWRNDAARCATALRLFIQHYNRTNRDFVFKSPDTLAAFVETLESLDLPPSNVRLLLRRPAGDKCALPAWSEGHLGAYAQCSTHRINPQVARSAAAYAHWLGIQAIDSDGNGIGQPIAQLAALLLCSVS